MSEDIQLKDIIEALGCHEDNSAVAVLERVGTNCAIDEVRLLTAKALVNRNTEDSLSVVLLREGKGINDLNTNVAMTTINEILQLNDKSKAVKVLDKASLENEDFNETIRETASSLKTLISFS